MFQYVFYFFDFVLEHKISWHVIFDLSTLPRLCFRFKLHPHSCCSNGAAKTDPASGASKGNMFKSCPSVSRSQMESWKKSARILQKKETLQNHENESKNSLAFRSKLLAFAPDSRHFMTRACCSRISFCLARNASNSDAWCSRLLSKTWKFWNPSGPIDPRFCIGIWEWESGLVSFSLMSFLSKAVSGICVCVSSAPMTFTSKAGPPSRFIWSESVFRCESLLTFKCPKSKEAVGSNRGTCQLSGSASTKRLSRKWSWTSFAGRSLLSSPKGFSNSKLMIFSDMTLTTETQVSKHADQTLFVYCTMINGEIAMCRTVKKRLSWAYGNGNGHILISCASWNSAIPAPISW